MVPRRRFLMAMTSVVAIALAAYLIAHSRERQPTVNHSISGELVAYEPSRQELTLRTGSGDRHVVVRKDTPVHEGVRTIVLAGLAAANGCPAKVWYREAEGKWIANDVRIFCAAVGTQRHQAVGGVD